MSIPEFQFPLKDFLTFLITLAGLIIAAKGLSTWQKQIKGTKEFDITYQLHYSLLKLRDAIKHVRNPAIWNAEFEAAKKHFKDQYSSEMERLGKDHEIRKKSTAHVYELRWQKITSAYTEMESHLLAAEVLYGNEITELIIPIKKHVTKLNLSLKQYLEPELYASRGEKIDLIVYDHSSEGEPDEFSNDLNNKIAKITSFLKSKIK